MENVTSLLCVVVVYEHFQGLKDKVRKFIGLNWKALAENGTLGNILKDSRFHELLLQAASNYRKSHAELGLLFSP